MKYLILLCLLVLSGASGAQAPDINTCYDGFLAPLAAQGKPAFFTSCKLPHTTVILFFPMGGQEGKYAEFDPSGLQANGGAVSISNELTVHELMGGIGARAVAMATINALARSPFQLVLPADLNKALTSQPKAACPAG